MKAYPGATWEAQYVGAAWDPMVLTGTNMPNFFSSGRDLGVSDLMKSHRGSALIGEVYIAPYMGTLPAGVVVARIKGGPKNGLAVPVDLEIPLTEATSNNTLKVREEYAKFFQKGDVLETMGAITNIGEPAAGVVTITATNSGSSTDKVKFELGNARMVIDQAVVALDKGAQTSVLYSNAVLYRAKLVNVTDEQIGTMGWVIDGQFVIMK